MQPHSLQITHHRDVTLMPIMEALCHLDLHGACNGRALGYEAFSSRLGSFFLPVALLWPDGIGCVWDLICGFWVRDLIQTDETRFGAFVCDRQIALYAFASDHVRMRIARLPVRQRGQLHL